MKLGKVLCHQYMINVQWLIKLFSDPKYDAIEGFSFLSFDFQFLKHLHELVTALSSSSRRRRNLVHKQRLWVHHSSLNLRQMGFGLHASNSYKELILRRKYR